MPSTFQFTTCSKVATCWAIIQFQNLILSICFLGTFLTSTFLVYVSPGDHMEWLWVQVAYLGDAGYNSRKVEKWDRKENAANNMDVIKPASVVGQELNPNRIWYKIHSPEYTLPRREEAWILMYQLLRIIGYSLILGVVNFQALSACHRSARGTSLHNCVKGFPNWQLKVGKNTRTW